MGYFSLGCCISSLRGVDLLIRFLKNDRGSIMLEFAVCGILFIGFVMGMVVMGLWMYNTSQVKQAARLAAINVATTGNVAESRDVAIGYMKKTLIACPVKNAETFSDQDDGYGVAEAEMNPLFPGFQKLIDPLGRSTINGRIHIRKEAMTVREYRFRPDNRDEFN